MRLINSTLKLFALWNILYYFTFCFFCHSFFLSFILSFLSVGVSMWVKLFTSIVTKRQIYLMQVLVGVMVKLLFDCSNICIYLFSETWHRMN